MWVGCVHVGLLCARLVVYTWVGCVHKVSWLVGWLVSGLVGY